MTHCVFLCEDCGKICFLKGRQKKEAQENSEALQRLYGLLSLSQTDSQVVASSGRLNLRRDFRWVAKRTGKFPHKYTQVANKPISRQTFPIFHWLIIG